MMVHDGAEDASDSQSSLLVCLSNTSYIAIIFPPLNQLTLLWSPLWMAPRMDKTSFFEQEWTKHVQRRSKHRHIQRSKPAHVLLKGPGVAQGRLLLNHPLRHVGPETDWAGTVFDFVRTSSLQKIPSPEPKTG